jgi:hypothetical protein
MVKGMAKFRPAVPSPDDPPGQVGRRPSSPLFLLVVAVMWIAVGVVVLTSVQADWHLIPGIVAIGIGLFFLRGASATILRRDARRSGG